MVPHSTSRLFLAKCACVGAYFLLTLSQSTCPFCAAHSRHASKLSFEKEITAKPGSPHDDPHNPSLCGLSAAAEGTRIFAADLFNHSIKCVDLGTENVHNSYNSDRWVVAVCVRNQSAENGVIQIAAFEVLRNGTQWEWRVCFLRAQDEGRLTLVSVIGISEQTAKRFSLTREKMISSEVYYW